MVAISAAAGIPPAVASIQDMFFPHWVERNLYVNIQTFASKWLDSYTTSDIPTAALKAFRYYPEASGPVWAITMACPGAAIQDFLLSMLTCCGKVACPISLTKSAGHSRRHMRQRCN